MLRDRWTLKPSAIVNTRRAAAHRPSRGTCYADRSEGTPNPGLRTSYEAMNAGNGQAIPQLRAGNCGKGDNYR